MIQSVVTGAAGLIGFEITKMLLSNGEAVLAVDDFRKDGYEDLSQLCRQFGQQLTILSSDLSREPIPLESSQSIGTIFHAAATLGVSYVERHPYETIRNNLLSTIATLDFAICSKCETFVFASSSENYSSSVGLGVAPVPTPEDILLSICDISLPRASYAASKIAGESAVYSAAAAAPFKPIIIRFHNVYGERMPLTHVIPELLERCKSKADPFRLYGAHQTRSFLHVQDAARAVLLAAAGSSGIYNVGSGEEITIEDLCNLIFEITRFHPTRVSRTDAPAGSVDRRTPDITKIKQLGFYPRVSLRNGIERCWKYRSEIA